jgi:hypothetical protein
MENTWYENHMMFDARGNYSASDDYAHDYNENIYIQCQTCKHYVHPAHGVIDQRINEFFCNECDKQHQENHGND